MSELNYNTFSITARCERTGQLGTAVATKFIAVGALCSFVKNGVGAISSQAYINPYLGIWGLEYLSQGYCAQETLEYLKECDGGINFRQFAIVDKWGNSAAFTGENSDTWHGDLVGRNYALAGNRLVSGETLEAMQVSFENSSEQALSQRLLTALKAGQNAGGDKQGHQSAAVKVYGEEDFPLLDLRVDEHPEPVDELMRVFSIAQEIMEPLIQALPIPQKETRSFEFQRSRLNSEGIYESF
ncbi:unannotated protein [freshwater metagenome]|uniref:Unannotated protein n=1 Tax=freshwater metagenome TaxID=449393 RepID=A0A6J7LPI2_9ZZZZ|nr:DUF1028 domain-containing protein [Actinomycetota bacterium]